MEFSGKRVLVTGSTRGLGLAAARLFLERGAEVILHGHDGNGVARAVTGLTKDHPGRVQGFPADLADRAACRRLAQQAGAVDVLVNNAGVLMEAMIPDTDLALWQRSFAINVTAPWVLSRALLEPLRARRGVIVNIGSDSGLLGYPGFATYCATKGAVIGLTRALAIELAPAVRAVCVCPGPIETDMMRKSLEATPDPAATRQVWEAYPALRRVASPEEIAEAILFAASPRASFMTGNLIVIDGGVTMGKRV
ncbi:short-chain dehydrogenase [Hypericibacter adhaerens]|jgi:NAD(P)-dependent dehydrogenase (short-subunit alcohol dehydrogenase family)|uniref:Short-chain dehydrogenase n=2 Tax=Hypericibacter adhaerens TaxID=2602016 RepID=A0A5J6MVD4_9PROT|nr:SDR family NAD(P)-dependent oxidoreductase [Hypericibacter adhaerens]QEX21399.1 short-chain dehydrogenase [Hypericibacter adhaerens]